MTIYRAHWQCYLPDHVEVDLLVQRCGRSLSAISQLFVALLQSRSAYRARGVWFGPLAMLRLGHGGPSAHRLAVNPNPKPAQETPLAAKSHPRKQISGGLQRGAVIIPANNEAAVIKRTLGPLSQAAVDGFVELIVVCNGCTDDTAEIARAVPGVQVVERKQGSKPIALNAGDEAATLWPRLYLDADIQISPAAVLAVLDRLSSGDVLAARPQACYDVGGASPLVRRYYRARQRISKHQRAMWGAGVYGLSAEGHRRLGAFPMITGDDLYVDTQFDADEKAVVATDPVIVTTPADARSLLAVLRRGHRGKAEMSTKWPRQTARTPGSGMDSAVAVLRAVRGPQSAVDAAVYIGMAFAKRWSLRQGQGWERDESSRSMSDSRSRSDELGTPGRPA